ncbi:MAG TPA: BBP7 family outer membrane beta-barrel protein, partial [Gemmataceae bacterium]|nr:BBP7 family outer membrane beta-barrel protein [Gemmataceae bacterium]
GFLMGVVVPLSLAAVAPAQTEELVPPPTPVTVHSVGGPMPGGPMPSVSELAHEVNPGLPPESEVVGLPQMEPGHKPDESHKVPPLPCVFAEADWIYWWLSSARVPVPLVAFLPPGNQPEAPGILGGNPAGFDVFSGARLRVGGWFDPEGDWGVEGSGFLLARQQRTLGALSDSGGNPSLVRPFLDASDLQTVLVPVSVPGVLVGTLTATAALNYEGAEANVVAGLVRQGWRLDALAGYRFLDLRESLNILQQGQVLPGAVLDGGPLGPLGGGTSFLIGDRFHTTNEFNGCQVGLRAQCFYQAVDLQLVGKIGVGDNRQEVQAVGATFVTPTPGGLAAAGGQAGFTSANGLLVQPSNAGTFGRDRASLISEIALIGGAQVTPHVRLTVGYSALYWGGVVRPGDQIDPVINSSQVPLNPAFRPGAVQGPARPATLFRTSDLWAQGLVLGVELSY